MPDAHSPSDPVADGDAERAQELFQSSQTFLMRVPDVRVMRLRVGTVAALLVVFFVVIPFLAARGVVPDDRVNTLGQFLCYAIVALGIDLIWGYTGLLSLCQALFFALGGYAMGMHLSLPEGGAPVEIPQFMSYGNTGHVLPWFWEPFRFGWFALLAGIAVPGFFGCVFGFFILRKRVRGVYFSIVTQALAAASWLLVCRDEMHLGGSTGLNAFYPAMASDKTWKIGLYLLTLTVLVLMYLCCRSLVKSRLGRVLVAVRDKETRLYFAGYKPYAFKVFAFSVGAMIAGVGGMLYAPQNNNINPQQMDVQASIFMVVMVALGGRGKLWGAILGALIFYSARSSLTSELPSSWNLIVGMMAIATVLFMPDGLSGLWVSMERQLAAGERFWRPCPTALPLLVISLFLAMEVLGLSPQVLRYPIIFIPIKYHIVVLLLAATSMLAWYLRRSVGMASSPSGAFPVIPLGAQSRPAPISATPAKGAM